jgi:predicted transcriptional regulator of viral defense system
MGIHRQTIVNFVKNNNLSKVRAGVYISPSSFDDEMYRLQGMCKAAIFSHDTALYVHDLSDRIPLRYTVTLPRGHNQEGLRKDNIKTVSIRKELYDIGITTGETMYGRPIRLYDSERALCDCISPRSRVDIAITSEAFKRYTAKREKNIPKLMEYAVLFGVEKKARTYLEVLL